MTVCVDGYQQENPIIMADKLLLEPGNYYHIYNRGNNGQNIFFEKRNYEFFLHRMDQYLSPFCEILAWVLLKNHFHLLVFIKGDIDTEKLIYTATQVPKKVDVHLQFGHFFNSYAKAINKRYERTGSLFEKNFERKLIDSEEHLRKAIHYIHHTPKKYGFTENVFDYPWSSYGSIISDKPTKLKRDLVLSLFGDVETFKAIHDGEMDYEELF